MLKLLNFLFMKKLCFIAAICFVVTAMGMNFARAQSVGGAQLPELTTPVPWTQSELLTPAILAGKINSGANKWLILNIGFMEDIKDATHIGPVSKAAGMETFKKTLSKLPRNTNIIIYCGCCPLYKCPNVRPAYLELKKSGFTNIKVLNLTTNLKTDWIGKGYPLAKAQ